MVGFGQALVTRITNPQRFRRLAGQKEFPRGTGSAYHGPALSTMVSPVDDCELRLLAHHADVGLGVRHPDGRVLVGSFFPALRKEVPDAFVDVSLEKIFRENFKLMKKIVKLTGTYLPSIPAFRWPSQHTLQNFFP